MLLSVSCNHSSILFFSIITNFPDILWYKFEALISHPWFGQRSTSQRSQEEKLGSKATGDLLVLLHREYTSLYLSRSKSMLNLLSHPGFHLSDVLWPLQVLQSQLLSKSHSSNVLQRGLTVSSLCLLSLANIWLNVLWHCFTQEKLMSRGFPGINIKNKKEENP